MRKNSGVLKTVLLVFLILIGGCSSHQTRPAAPITVFNPTPGGTFNIRAVIFQLEGNGMPQRVESGIVPIEQKAISALEGLGYRYAPDGDVNYLVEVRIGSISPKLAAEGASQQVGIAVGPLGGWPEFYDYPVLINEWTPEIQRIRSGPDSCFITMQILIKEVRQDRDYVIYHGTPRPVEVPFSLGCPFDECGQNAAELVTDYVLKLFAPPTRK
ncbi:hypothetical protein [Maridesulfovibrio sp.]|uniref:hypothetical protein n=1 Tax=Maridesulfovibrio sp. TaxID=2795000 RepID=UPI002A18D33E|nr:hypothetical protein [Maridesulfovibrio sp.]